MRRITVKIPDDLDVWLRFEATRRDIAVADLVGEALLEYRSARPRGLCAAGVGASDEGDVSERVEEILAAEWGHT